MAKGEDERPPIIVKGGSLIIQSGDEKSTNPKHQKGKKWKKDGPRWTPDHGDGKHVANYSVSFQGGGGSCAPTFATEVRVTYKLTTGEKVVIVIGRREKSASDKDMEPLVTSPKELKEDNDREQPTLTLPGKGEIVSIAAGSSVCANPVSAKLQPVK